MVCSILVIYCEVGAQPEGWSNAWNAYNNIVYWGVSNSGLIYKNVKYYFNNDEAIADYYIDANKEIELVSEINFKGNVYYVKEIDDFAFCGLNVESIVIPEGITYLDRSAFESCENLKNITLPSTLECLYYDVFCNDFNLENVYFNGTIEDWCKVTIYSNPMYYASNFYILAHN